MKKRVIIKESRLRKIIKESVKHILNEAWPEKPEWELTKRQYGVEGKLSIDGEDIIDIIEPNNDIDDKTYETLYDSLYGETFIFRGDFEFEAYDYEGREGYYYLSEMTSYDGVDTTIKQIVNDDKIYSQLIKDIDDYIGSLRYDWAEEEYHDFRD